PLEPFLPERRLRRELPHPAPVVRDEGGHPDDEAGQGQRREGQHDGQFFPVHLGEYFRHGNGPLSRYVTSLRPRGEVEAGITLILFRSPQPPIWFNHLSAHIFPACVPAPPGQGIWSWLVL